MSPQRPARAAPGQCQLLGQPGPPQASAPARPSQCDNRAKCQPRWPSARIDRGTGQGPAPMTHIDTAHAPVLHDDATGSDGSRTVSRRRPPRVTSGAKPRPGATTRRCAEAAGQGPGRPRAPIERRPATAPPLVATAARFPLERRPINPGAVSLWVATVTYSRAAPAVTMAGLDTVALRTSGLGQIPSRETCSRAAPHVLRSRTVR